MEFVKFIYENDDRMIFTVVLLVVVFWGIARIVKAANGEEEE